MKDRYTHTASGNINLGYSLKISDSVSVQKTRDKSRQVMVALQPKYINEWTFHNIPCCSVWPLGAAHTRENTNFT